MLGSYRAQIEQCEKLKVELDLIHDAINRTKQEIAVLHGKSFSGDEMAKVTGELGAVVGGTEEATQQILEAAEAIDQAAGALGKPMSPDQQARLSEEIQDRVVGIFEACNFQDLTGQRISKVMTTMKFIEHHINVMMDIWGGVDAIKQHAPAIIDTRVGDARLLNGPEGGGRRGTCVAGRHRRDVQLRNNRRNQPLDHDGRNPDLVPGFFHAHDGRRIAMKQPSASSAMAISISSAAGPDQRSITVASAKGASAWQICAGRAIRPTTRP